MREVDDYIAGLPTDQAAALTHLREVVAAAAPDAVDAVAYKMPAFKLGKRVLIYYAAFKDHLSLFPGSGALKERLGPEQERRFTGKGTLQFTPADPLPDDVIRRIVAIRREEIRGG